jgi:hypothetical protein
VVGWWITGIASIVLLSLIVAGRRRARKPAGGAGEPGAQADNAAQSRDAERHFPSNA